MKGVPMKKEKDFNTLCVHNAQEFSHDHTGAISTPIYQSATFVHPNVGSSTGYDYSRLQNPTREQLETLICNLEGGQDALAFSSGMAAITTVFQLFKPGDHIVTSLDLYGGSHRLFDYLSSHYNLHFTYVDTTDASSVASSITSNTKAIYVETPSNPMMHITDLQAMSTLAKQHELLFIVDNTFLTPYFQKPFLFGANIIVHSGTKFLSGHNDTLSGFVVVDSIQLSEQLRYLIKTVGSGLSPFDSWLMIRGIKTLAIRMREQEKSALQLAEWLKEHPKINKVFYAGLPDHPGYAIMKKQASGFGSMISFECANASIAQYILNHTSTIHYAESLGGVETLITYPMLQTHADIPEEERNKKGINDCLLRLSVGIESIDDLIHEFDTILKEAY
jgi:cystathionine gamma-synthase